MMDLARYSKQYIDGVESFLDFAYSYGDLQGEEIQFSCAKCCNFRWTRTNVVYDHLICYGFVKGYTRWINHEEWDIKLNVDDDMDYSRDDIDGLLNDQFRDVAQTEGVYDGPNEEAKKFYNLVEEIDIVELDYYSLFMVVLFKRDWYEVENDTYVYFNKRCSQEEPFVLGSQLHQCFYVKDPYDQDRHYVMKNIPRFV
ncbi:hypothetical protein MTR67_052131 [Solanum verrucosum]|uniref:Transposase-associated domain-containing protein n=1 Tax=Solanum verrucosum TaxID=315347 RepID=A0AAF0V8K3_SOLVR|nr:hypothetical protein MTR67_052131 [Solanum verrucosum]